MSLILKLLSSVGNRKAMNNNLLQVRQFCASFNDSSKSNEIALAPAQDILYKQLKNAISTKAILGLVNSHNKIMNHKHLLQALRSLFTLQKLGNSDLTTKEILKHSDFTKLCTSLKHQSGRIELNEAVEALKVISYVGVPSESTITQVLLQLLRHQINHLSVQQLIFVEFILAQMKQTPLTQALLIALPLVFQIQLPTKLEKDNLWQMCDCLQFVSKKNLATDCVELIVSSLMKYNGPIDPKTSLSIAWSILDLPPDIFHEALYRRSISILLHNLDQLDIRELETTLSKMSKKYNSKYPFYYDESFFDACANLVIDQDKGHQSALYFLPKFERVNHVHNKLLDYICTHIHHDNRIFEDSDAFHLFILATCIGMTDYRPIYWEEIKCLYEKTDKFTQYDKSIFWIKFASTLSFLDIYKPEVLAITFGRNYLQKAFQSAYFSDFEHLLLIKQGVNLYKPEYKHMLPSKEFEEKFEKKIKIFLDFPLKGALEQSLGGEHYVKTHLRTHLNHFIDHAVIMRKGGYPVAFSQNDKSNLIEDIILTDEQQLILIVGLHRHHYTANNITKSDALFKIRTLEALGYSVVSIGIEKWNNLLDFEKIPYLMQAIKVKSNFDEVFSYLN